MTEARRKARIAMLEKNIGFGDLARMTGLSRGSIHNLLSDFSKSGRGRRRITNALGCQVWDDVAVTARSIPFEMGTIFVFPTLGWAEDFADEIKELCERRDRHVRLRRDLQVTFEILTAPDEQDPARAAELAARTSGGLEIWSGDVPAGSPFSPNKLVKKIRRGARQKSRTHGVKKAASKSVAASSPNELRKHEDFAQLGKNAEGSASPSKRKN